MKLQKRPLENIINGKKIIESRLFDDKRRIINIGDQIEFSCVDDQSKKVLTKVRALYRYESFSDLFSDFEPEFFGGTSKSGLNDEINQFYSIDDQKKYGVLGIRIALI